MDNKRVRREGRESHIWIDIEMTFTNKILDTKTEKKT